MLGTRPPIEDLKAHAKRLERDLHMNYAREQEQIHLLNTGFFQRERYRLTEQETKAKSLIENDVFAHERQNLQAQLAMVIKQNKGRVTNETKGDYNQKIRMLHEQEAMLKWCLETSFYQRQQLMVSREENREIWRRDNRWYERERGSVFQELQDVNAMLFRVTTDANQRAKKPRLNQENSAPPAVNAKITAEESGAATHQNGPKYDPKRVDETVVVKHVQERMIVEVDEKVAKQAATNYGTLGGTSGGVLKPPTKTQGVLDAFLSKNTAAITSHPSVKHGRSVPFAPHQPENGVVRVEQSGALPTAHHPSSTQGPPKPAARAQNTSAPAPKALIRPELKQLVDSVVNDFQKVVDLNGRVNVSGFGRYREGDFSADDLAAVIKELASLMMQSLDPKSPSMTSIGRMQNQVPRELSQLEKMWTEAYGGGQTRKVRASNVESSASKKQELETKGYNLEGCYEGIFRMAEVLNGSILLADNSTPGVVSYKKLPVKAAVMYKAALKKVDATGYGSNRSGDYSEEEVSVSASVLLTRIAVEYVTDECNQRTAHPKPFRHHTIGGMVRMSTGGHGDSLNPCWSGRIEDFPQVLNSLVQDHLDESPEEYLDIRDGFDSGVITVQGGLLVSTQRDDVARRKIQYTNWSIADLADNTQNFARRAIQWTHDLRKREELAVQANRELVMGVFTAVNQLLQHLKLDQEAQHARRQQRKEKHVDVDEERE